jgi:hypothetical protein
MIGPYRNCLPELFDRAGVVAFFQRDDSEQVQCVGMSRREFQHALAGLPRLFELSLLELP